MTEVKFRQAQLVPVLRCSAIVMPDFAREDVQTAVLRPFEPGDVPSVSARLAEFRLGRQLASIGGGQILIGIGATVVDARICPRPESLHWSGPSCLLGRGVGEL